MKRGTDHGWQIVRYKGNMAYYARCKCQYQYACGQQWPNNEISKFYRYCPNCGARKKWYSTDVKLIEW